MKFMFKLRSRSVITLVIVLTLCTCIDPYNPKFTGYASLLVVDGMITDANASYTVKLLRSFQDLTLEPVKVTDASVSISDDLGNTNSFIDKGEGIYKTDSVEFRGVIGRKYILSIRLKDGSEYMSDQYLMQSVPDIDNIYFGKDSRYVKNKTQVQDGVSIYLDSKGDDNTRYFRWDFEETWKFKVPSPKKYDYINDSTIIPTSIVNEYCWKTMNSSDILIHSVEQGQSGSIEKQQVSFIATNLSDRLLLQYSILVNQYSISQNEFEFWDNLKQLEEGGGDIFSKQPYIVTSNLHSVNNPGERVLGYFSVSAVKQKRKNIAFRDIAKMNLPFYRYPCNRIAMSPADYPRPSSVAPLITWDGLYAAYCIKNDYYFVEPLYIPGTNTLQKLIFARPECANCALTGTLKKPDFWIDLK